MTPSATPDPATLLAEGRHELARLPAILEAMLSELDEVLWRARPAPKEWSAVEIVCHMRDEETEDFGARARVILEGGSEFVKIDPERWAVERRYHEADPSVALGALLERRAASLAYLRHVDPQHLTRALDHQRLGRLSGLDIVAAWVAHDRLHLAQLAATLARAGADRWAPLRSEYAGPISYPPQSA